MKLQDVVTTDEVKQQPNGDHEVVTETEDVL